MDNFSLQVLLKGLSLKYMNKLKNGYTICLIVIGLLSINLVSAQYGGVGSSGGGGYDYTAPAISNINAVVSAKTATITWTTDESSLSWVVYGTSTIYGLDTKTTTYNTSHSLVLSNLSPVTTYHYSVKSKDSTGNIGAYTDKTFTTLTAAAEVVSATPTVTLPTVSVPTAPVTIPSLPASPTISDMGNVLAAIAQQVAYIQANITSPNALTLLLGVAQQLSQVQSALAVVSPVTAAPTAAITKSLFLGAKNDEVTALQNFLKAQGADVYPEGLVTGYFGSLTKKAVGKFQLKYGIVADSSDPGYGFVGPKTRVKINELLGL